MKLRFIPLILACLLIVGCSRPTVTPDKFALCGPEPTIERVQAEVAIRVGMTNWKDPNSIMVRNARVRSRLAAWRGLVNGGGYHYGWLITYEVNGRNSYGGFTGFQEREFMICPDDCPVCKS